MLFEFAPWLHEVFKDHPMESFVFLDVGKLCAWSERWVLYLDYWEADRSVRMIMDGLEHKARPLVEEVGDDRTTYDFLIRNVIAETWLVNYAAVAAELIFLGKRMGHRKYKVLALMEPVRIYIKASLVGVDRVDDYLARVWDRA